MTMTKETAIKLFEQNQIRFIWKEEDGVWYFSIRDVIADLTGTDRPHKYWRDLKAKLQKEGKELPVKIGQLKLAAKDCKFRFTDIADTEQQFRLMQSNPLPKVESFKMWLAQHPKALRNAFEI